MAKGTSTKQASAAKKLQKSEKDEMVRKGELSYEAEVQAIR